MSTFARGDLVEMDGLLGVIVGLPGDANVPDGHFGIWTGEPKGPRISEGGAGGMRPEIWTIPAEYVSPSAAPIFKH